MIPLGKPHFLPFLQNAIIRVNALALIYFWHLKGGRNRALVSFLRNRRIWRKTLIFIWLGIRKTGKRTYCPWIPPDCNDQPSIRRKILRRDLSFEGTVHSWRHDSSETGAINGRWTKIDKRNAICKFNETWSQRNLPNFTRKNEWPAKSPVLNPVQNFRSIIDKDLVPKTIGTWKKTHDGDEKAKETKYLISRTIAKHVHCLAVPYKTKTVESPTFTSFNFFPSMFQNGHKFLKHPVQLINTWLLTIVFMFSR